MPDDARATYPPLNTLKPVAENLWIVDGPVIRFGFPWPKLPFPTRMTVIRLGSGVLFVHSPTPLTPSLRAEIERQGRVGFLVGPNPSITGGFPNGNRHSPMRKSIWRRASASRPARISISPDTRSRL